MVDGPNKKTDMSTFGALYSNPTSPADKLNALMFPRTTALQEGLQEAKQAPATPKDEFKKTDKSPIAMAVCHPTSVAPPTPGSAGTAKPLSKEAADVQHAEGNLKALIKLKNFDVTTNGHKAREAGYQGDKPWALPLGDEIEAVQTKLKGIGLYNLETDRFAAKGTNAAIDKLVNAAHAAGIDDKAQVEALLDFGYANRASLKSAIGSLKKSGDATALVAAFKAATQPEAPAPQGDSKIQLKYKPQKKELKLDVNTDLNKKTAEAAPPFKPDFLPLATMSAETAAAALNGTTSARLTQCAKDGSKLEALLQEWVSVDDAGRKAAAGKLEGEFAKLDPKDQVKLMRGMAERAAKLPGPQQATVGGLVEKLFGNHLSGMQADTITPEQVDGLVTVIALSPPTAQAQAKVSLIAALLRPAENGWTDAGKMGEHLGRIATNDKMPGGLELATGFLRDAILGKPAEGKNKAVGPTLDYSRRDDVVSGFLRAGGDKLVGQPAFANDLLKAMTFELLDGNATKAETGQAQKLAVLLGDRAFADKGMMDKMTALAAPAGTTLSPAEIARTAPEKAVGKNAAAAVEGLRLAVGDDAFNQLAKMNHDEAGLVKLYKAKLSAGVPQAEAQKYTDKGLTEAAKFLARAHLARLEELEEQKNKQS
ncbi:MAG: hypothetical protein HY903_03575 [Deltaproteobacteria bacterium]|nr:hypothetical protein [Deltaproteobacteria bacterium]